ncbi:hypothetical protein D5086_017295 [Populus alba]|uniref:Uncharacterized protein n=1 Tax=Populus alba TaxID=43335 RepID=A0ACC4BZ39_POPAL
MISAHHTLLLITLVDVVNSNREARVRAKHRKRAIQHTPPTAPPPSSFKPCAHPPASPVSIKPHCGPSVETSSLGSRSGAENPRIGTAPLPSPTAQGQATSGNLTRKEVQGELTIDPMAVEAAVVVDKSRGRLNLPTSITSKERQYLTRSKVAANSTFGRPGKSLGMRGQPSSHSSADSRI